MFEQATVLKITFIMWADLKSSLSDETRFNPFSALQSYQAGVAGTWSFLEYTASFPKQELLTLTGNLHVSTEIPQEKRKSFKP